MIRLVSLLLLCSPLVVLGQFTYTLDQSIPVKGDGGADIPIAWAGGLNAAQFNTMDLNGDGTDDLVLFDRMAHKIITFVASENRYIPAPEFEELFPADIYNWLLLRDYNCDGKKDIFTGDVLGIKVYKNVSSTPGDLQWEQYLFSTGFDGPKSPVLLTKGLNLKVNLQIQFDDLPSITDMDGDGDLDILNMQYAGQTIEFHQNLSMENFQSCDSLEFTRVTRSWGNFRECFCGNFAFNGESCPPGSGRTKHAGGKSLLAIDLNGDQQQDLLFAEAECNQLYALPNGGTGASPVIESFSAFPQNHPVNFVLFPAAFYEDVDFDGKKDLISTPNIFTKEFFNTNLQQSTWFYKNTGSTLNPNFTFVQSNFLQEQMIDVGDNAIPAFTDYDGDGDFDLLISSHSSEQFTSRIYLYKNTGSASSPVFTLESNDFLGFSASRLFNVKIQIADINSDRTDDLVFTASSLDNNATNLYFLPNKSQNALDFGGVSLKTLDFGLTSSENVYVVDVSGDGLPDILAGRSEGNLEYWKNTGVAGTPVFSLEEENFLGLASVPTRQNPTIAIADFDGDGLSDLLIGDQSGRPGIISNFRSGLAGEPDINYDLIFNPAIGSYVAKNLGGKIWPIAVNLFNANRPALVIGNSLGGIHVLRNDEGTSLPEEPQVNVYPNPVPKYDAIKVQADRHGTMQIISILGQQLTTPIVLKANEVYEYRLPSWAAGIYLLKFTSNKKTHTQRFMIK